MNEATIATLMAVTLFITVGILAWNLLPERVYLKEGFIQKKYRGKSEGIKLSELKEILYSYHAVVGFIGVWEFYDINGKELTVDSQALGVKSLLSALEQQLNNFSLKTFQQEFEAGDVEDTIHVWKNKNKEH
ncbi:hypothetical protein [Aurantivibrio infirmus]